MTSSLARSGLSDGYGVLVGAKVSFYRDNPNNFGRYHHGHLVLRAGSREYDCAIDIDSGGKPDGHKWSSFDLDDNDFAAVRSLSNGWHFLRPNSASGALDYLRSPELASKVSWIAGDSISAVEALEGFVAEGKRYFVFGEPFTTGHGVHNVHQNQGSKIGGGHDAENGIWQDGAVLIQKGNGTLVAYLNKFSNQADRTDNRGRPTSALSAEAPKL